MERDDHDIQLKFEGEPITALGGAPAEMVVNALLALQRMAYLIGMKNEGRAFGQRAKPSANVRREFAIVCRQPVEGSHVQPFTVGSRTGDFSAESVHARQSLLSILHAFDSGNEASVNEAIPDPRERWFLAEAASGLLPDEQSGVQISIRSGAAGVFAFKADRARTLIGSLRSGGPPKPGLQKILFKVRGIEFLNHAAVLQPSDGRIMRLPYLPVLEPLFQANARKRVLVAGEPSVNSAGYITGFDTIESIGEFGPTAQDLHEFQSGNQLIRTNESIKLAASFEYDDKLFVFQDEKLGIDAWAHEYRDLRQAVMEELDVLWRNYACAPDEDLAKDALKIKKALNKRFEVVLDDA